MEMTYTTARFDWLAELGGATALALAGGHAAWAAAPSLGWPGPAAMTGTGFAGFALGLLAMRAVRPKPRAHPLAGFSVEPIEADELLLDEPVCEPLLLEEVVEDDLLLLVDRLDEPAADSRVVQLFASPPIPTVGRLGARGGHRLASGTMHVVHEFEGPASDASDALYAALADLRRSLR